MPALQQANPLYYFSQAPLQPAIEQDRCPWVEIPVQMAPAQVVAAGTVLGLQTAANATDVQTITVSGGSGSMVFSLSTVLGTIGPFAYNISLANLQAALQAVFGAGNLLVTGTPGSSYVITAANQLLYGALPLMVLAGVSSGLTASIAHTTVGVLNNSAVAYPTTASGLQAPPTTAPTATDSAGAGTWPAGDYIVSYTYVTAAGETTPGPITAYASGGTKKIHIAAISTIPTPVTALNFYVDGLFVIQKATSAGSVSAFDMDLADAATNYPNLPVPRTNTAFIVVDGSHVPVGVLVAAVNVDVFGNVTLGSSGGAQVPVTPFTASMVIEGYLRAEALTGMDANALSALKGRLVMGTLSNGLIKL